jgi:hypothetical protein
MTDFRIHALAPLCLAGLLTVACDNSDDSKDSASGSASQGGDTDSSGDTNDTGDSGSSDGGTGGASDTADSDPSGGSDPTGESTTGDPTDSGGDTDGDTDGAGSTGEGGMNEVCQAPGDVMPCDADTTDPFQAIGLGCPFAPNQSIAIHNEIFQSLDATAWRIANQFGTHVDDVSGEPAWGPREGEKFLIITTGTLPEPDDNGIITMEEGSTQSGTSNENPDDKPLPAPMSPFQGSASGNGGTPFVDCDGVNDCSDSLEDQWDLGNGDANDMVWFQFSVPVPGGTHGFSFDFAYFSAEFPEFVDTSFNDVFAVWSSSETYTGNLCFVNDQPCTVTALANSVQFEGASPELVGTGFDGMSGSSPLAQATGWFEAKGSAEPGEMLQLTFSLFDMGDSIYDTAVMLDNFRWDCEGCVPTEVDPCIGIDPV